MPVIPATWRLRQENCLNPGGGSCGELRSCHCTSPWATRAKRHLKRKRKKGKEKEREKKKKGGEGREGKEREESRKERRKERGRKGKKRGKGKGREKNNCTLSYSIQCFKVCETDSP